MSGEFFHTHIHTHARAHIYSLQQMKLCLCRACSGMGGWRFMEVWLHIFFTSAVDGGGLSASLLGRLVPAEFAIPVE
jgi:hypothetical protein